MVDINKAKLDPAGTFQRPAQVLKDNTLSRHEKIDILRRWAYDEREMEVAEEENMRSASTNDDRHNVLDEISNCLIILGVNDEVPHPPPTKQG